MSAPSINAGFVDLLYCPAGQDLPRGHGGGDEIPLAVEFLPQFRVANLDQGGLAELLTALELLLVLPDGGEYGEIFVMQTPVTVFRLCRLDDLPALDLPRLLFGMAGGGEEYRATISGGLLAEVDGHFGGSGRGIQWVAPGRNPRQYP